MRTNRALIIIGKIVLGTVLLCGGGLIAGVFLYLAMLAGLAGGG